MLREIQNRARARLFLAPALFLLVTGGMASACSAPAPTAAPPSAAQPIVGSLLQATGAPVVIQTVVVEGVPAAATPGTDQSVGGAPSVPLAIDRRIIKNAQLTETVENTDTAIARITGIATDVGGYVAGTHTFVEASHKGGQITIGVPVDRFEEALNLVRKVALTLDSDVTSSSDVSAQYVDLQSRLTNLQATADRIREFLGKAQTVDEALKINAQLSDVESQIEQIKGQLNVLSTRTAFSTITLDIHEELPTPTPTLTPTPTPTPTPVGWHPDQTFKSAVDVQSTLLRAVGDLLIWFLVVLLPYIVVIGIFVSGVAWLLRRLSKPRAPNKTA
jgi:hypothetical protein